MSIKKVTKEQFDTMIKDYDGFYLQHKYMNETERFYVTEHKKDEDNSIVLESDSGSSITMTFPYYAENGKVFIAGSMYSIIAIKRISA